MCAPPEPYTVVRARRKIRIVGMWAEHTRKTRGAVACVGLVHRALPVVILEWGSLPVADEATLGVSLDELPKGQGRVAHAAGLLPFSLPLALSEGLLGLPVVPRFKLLATKAQTAASRGSSSSLAPLALGGRPGPVLVCDTPEPPPPPPPKF